MRWYVAVGGVVLAAVLASACGDRALDELRGEGLEGEPSGTAGEALDGEVEEGGGTETGWTADFGTVGLLSLPPPPIDRPDAGPPDAGPPPDLCVDGPYCFTFENEHDFSFIHVSIGCESLITDITVRDLDRDRFVGRLFEDQPSHCDDDRLGFKVDGVSGKRVEVCIETSRPINPAAITIQTKAATRCETDVEGTVEDCSC